MPVARAGHGEPQPSRVGGTRRGPSRPLLVAAGLFVVAAILAGLALSPRGASRSPTLATHASSDPAEQASRLPAAPKAAFKIGAPVPLARHRDETTWAAVRTDVVARAEPFRDARAVGTLRAQTPEATTNIVLPLARRHLWVKVRLPALPNGTVGWVPRSALGAYGTVRTRLVVDIAKRTLVLRKDGREVLQVPVGVGAPDAPTPRGEFVVRNVLTRFSSTFYGPIALGTSARSETLTDWPGGGYVGIHGTDQPQLIPGAVSHGCIRLRNADIVRLAKLLPIGTPLTIR